MASTVPDNPPPEDAVESAQATENSTASQFAEIGKAVEDLLPVPHATQPVTDPSQGEVSHTLAEDPTLSHALATDDHEVKGLAQQHHEDEVLDLGWNQKKQEIAEPLVGGMDNEELWMLIRRFDKVCTASLFPVEPFVVPEE